MKINLNVNKSVAILFCVKKSMEKVPAKRFCSNSKEAIIGTHDGVFHCDDVLACFLLKELPQFKDAKVIRTRDENKLRECDVVVDVGGVFDASSHRYDHHQRSFNETLNSLRPEKPFKIKLSSAGLIYAHFGHEIIAHLLDCDQHDKRVDPVFDKVYDNFIQEIDGIDNGMNMIP